MHLPDAVADFCDALRSLQIRYLVGGSFASSIWGHPRHTNDINIEVWLNADNIDAFWKAFSSKYLIDQVEVDRVMRDSSEFRSVQALLLADLLKFDLFVKTESVWSEETYQRGVEIEISPGRKIRIQCAEHVIVQKLRWYDMGNRVSERQWKDVLHVKKVATVDWSLVARWASEFGLLELADKLRHSES